MSYIGRGSAGWWEVMLGECSGHFESRRGRRLVWCGASGRRRLVGFVLWKKKAGRGPCGSERRGGVSWAGRDAEA
jgi:hypothetical protein